MIPAKTLRQAAMLPLAALLLAGLPAGPAAHAQAPAATPQAVAPQATAPQVTVDGAWSRATPRGAQTAAIYLTLSSPAGDRLTGASTPAAAGATVHEMRMDGTVMIMREVEGGLALPPGQRVTLRPGGYHIMLTGLKAPLAQGGTVQVHLTFEKAPPLDVTATIASVGASVGASIGASSAPGAPPGQGMVPQGMAPHAGMPGMKMN